MRTYIGATVDLDRRLEQHNGMRSGGAKATKRFRPWSLLISVSGFTTWSEALRFEWRWKHIFVEKRRRYRSSRGVRERKKRCIELMSLYPYLISTLSDETYCG